MVHRCHRVINLDCIAVIPTLPNGTSLRSLVHVYHGKHVGGQCNGEG